MLLQAGMTVGEVQDGGRPPAASVDVNQASVEQPNMQIISESEQSSEDDDDRSACYNADWALS